jgi:hypothetical protein
MGSAFTPGGATQGVIPCVMDTIFDRVRSTRDADFAVRVGYVEIHQVRNELNGRFQLRLQIVS